MIYCICTVYHFLLFGIEKNNYTHLFIAPCQFCSKNACVYKRLRYQNSIQKNAVKAVIRRLTASFGRACDAVKKYTRLFCQKTNNFNHRKRSYRPLHFSTCLSFFFYDFLAFVVAACAAYAMCAIVFAALRAFDHSGKRKLPNIGASLISARFRHFSLRYRHENTPP